MKSILFLLLMLSLITTCFGYTVHDSRLYNELKKANMGTHWQFYIKEFRNGTRNDYIAVLLDDELPPVWIVGTRFKF